MKRTVLTGFIATTLLGLSTAAQSADSSRAEMTGAGSGAVIGGAIAGPPGIVFGAAIGAVFGDRWHDKNAQIGQLDAALEQERRTLARLDGELGSTRLQRDDLRRELGALDASGARDLHRLLARGLEIDLPFRTDESQLPDGVSERIAAIATLLSGTPGLAVQVDGYADPRGSIEYNAKLSLQRAESVRTLLTRAGLDPSRIVTFGHGESIVDAGTATQDPDQFALQRRVTVTFYRDESAMSGIAQLSDMPDR